MIFLPTNSRPVFIQAYATSNDNDIAQLYIHKDKK